MPASDHPIIPRRAGESDWDYAQVVCVRCGEDPLADLAAMPGELPEHDAWCPSR